MAAKNFNGGNIQYMICRNTVSVHTLKPVTLDLIIRDGDMENLSSVTSAEATNWAGREKV
jgi:hypothetical protein